MCTLTDIQKIGYSSPSKGKKKKKGNNKILITH